MTILDDEVCDWIFDELSWWEGSPQVENDLFLFPAAIPRDPCLRRCFPVEVNRDSRLPTAGISSVESEDSKVRLPLPNRLPPEV